MARPQRSVSAVLVAAVALAGLLAAGQWLQPRLDGPREAASTTRPLAVGAGPGAVWVRGAEGWLWRVDPDGDRQAGSTRLRTVPGGAELAGKLVVASGVLWVTDPGPGVVRRVDLRSGTEDRWEADGRHSR